MLILKQPALSNNVQFTVKTFPFKLDTIPAVQTEETPFMMCLTTQLTSSQAFL